ncbi:MAG: NADH-quinone oxidoreductase subunit J/K [Emcibacter sp.]|nr:NADH-quinone oxidoreductase subunit J/K [Emcibacter sp.]
MSDLVTLYVPLETTALSLGADELVLALLEEAAKRHRDVEIIRNGSWGMSWLEPLVEVVTDKGRIAYGNVTPDDVAGLFEADFLKGGDHDLCQGLTEEIPYLKTQDRLTFARCGLIDALSLDDYRENGGFLGLEKALDMTAQQIVTQVTDSGLRGRGGAAFPTGIKWNTVLHAPNNSKTSEQKYICCNADEGDSGTFADRILMEGDPYALIEGMIIAGLAVGATKGFIYLRSEYPLCKEILGEALINARAEGWIGQDIKGSGKAFDIELRMGAGSYVCGEETAMLDSLEGKRGMVRAKPPLPAIQGLFGQPTVVNNVLSLASVPIIMAKGAAFYQDFGMGRSRGTIAFQLAGNIARGGLVEKAFGISLRQLIEEYGGGTITNTALKAVQVGGPLGAYIAQSDLDLPMDYEAFSDVGAVLGHGGIVVFDAGADMAAQAKFAFDFCAVESCGKCTPCRIGSVRGSELMAKVQAGENVEHNLELVRDLCDVLDGGSLCAMGGMTPIPVLSALKYWPQDFKTE